MAAYASVDYWDERYENDPEPFDWYQRYDMFRIELLEHIRPDHKVLIVGCGNSSLGEGLYQEGIKDITNIDFSRVVIGQMRSKHSDKPGMQFQELDVTDMSKYDDDSFDVVLDKATLDTLLCGDTSSKSISNMTREVYRVLKPQGKFIMVSHAKKQQRLNYLSKPEFRWSIDTQKLTRPSFDALPLDDDASYHYMYICEKVDE